MRSRGSAAPKPASARAPTPGKAAARPFALGVAATIAVGGLAALLYIEAGGFDVAATKPHNALTYWATNTMMVRSVKLRALGIETPRQFTPAQVLAGFRIYDAQCAGCHGAPAVDVRTRWADGLNPGPPFLVGVSREWTPGELFWIVKHGVKMTGMPAWDRTCTDQEIWDLVAFLEALPRMNATSYRQLHLTNTQRAGPPDVAAPAGCRP